MKNVHNIGTSRAGEYTRIWLEGSRLLSAGFKHKLLFSREWSEGTLTLRIVTAKQWEELPRPERGTVAGSPERPIIDITGTKVLEAFAPHTRVTVNYQSNRIIITAETES